MRTERTERFFDRLRENGLTLTAEEIEREDFLHCFFVTTDAALRSRRREKIDLLADLLTGSVRSDKVDSADEYEEMLQILDDLSYRELTTLSLMEKVESETPRDDPHDESPWVKRCRKTLDSLLEERFALSVDEIDPFLRRLGRSGLLTRVTIYNETSTTITLTLDAEHVKLSPIYYRMREILVQSSPSQETQTIRTQVSKQ